jgi:hypothetical protein
MGVAGQCLAAVPGHQQQVFKPHVVDVAERRPRSLAITLPAPRTPISPRLEAPWMARPTPWPSGTETPRWRRLLSRSAG